MGGKEGVHLYSFRIWSASFQNFCRSLPALNMAEVQVAGLKMCDLRLDGTLQVRWGARRVICVVRTGGINTWFRVTESEILHSCSLSSPPCLPHWTGRGRTLYNFCNSVVKDDFKRRNGFYWLDINLKRCKNWKMLDGSGQDQRELEHMLSINEGCLVTFLLLQTGTPLRGFRKVRTITTTINRKIPHSVPTGALELNIFYRTLTNRL